MKWLKFDMHMHSNYSRSKTGDIGRVKEMTAKEFVDTLVAKSIDVFSITDHNVISEMYYADIMKYISENSIRIKCVMGVELDVKVQLTDETTPYINVLFYFKEHYTGIENVVASLISGGNPSIIDVIDCFNKNNYNYLIIPEGTGDRGIVNFINKMTPEEAKMFNINGIYKIFGGFDKTVKDRFNAELWALGFYQNSIELSRLLSNFQGNQDDLIDDIVDHLKTGKTLDSKLKNEIATGIRQTSLFIARFKFSDWHNKEPYTPEYYNHIFGDESKPFESFELALIDPESRLVVSKDLKIIENNSFMKKIEFKLNGEPKVIEFTEGLNVIIGERGSGKSLLHTIIKSLKDGEEELKSYNKQFKITELKITLNNSQVIDYAFPFESIEVIDQAGILNYFETQPNLERYLSQNFKELDKIDLSLIEKVIDISENIVVRKQLNDNLTPVIDNIVQTDGYILSSKIQNNNHNPILVKYNDLKDSINNFYSEVMNQGYDVTELYKSVKEISFYSQGILKKSELLQVFKNESKQIIDVEIKKSKDDLNRTQNSYQLIDNYKARVDEYLDSFLQNEKMNFLLDNIQIKKPKPSIVWHDLGYLFVRSSKLKNEEAISDNLKSTIVGCVYRGNNQEFESQVVSVLSGVNRFNKDKEISKELRKYVSSLEVGTETHLYKCVDSLNLKDEELTLSLLEELQEKELIQSVTNGSLGMKTAAYLDFAFESDNEILLFDQPEDNIDNMYISNRLVKLIKNKKKSKQLIFVTHNPSIAVYSDAFNYVIAKKDVNKITYRTIEISDKQDKDKILNILDGGKFSFANRNSKYGNIIGGIDYEN